MISLLAAAPDAAYQLGQRIGMFLGPLLLIGFLFFAVVSIIKAFTRRTPGWIVAACLSGALVLLVVVGMGIGVVYGFMSARQRATASHPASAGGDDAPVSATPQIITGRDLAYTIAIPAGWSVKRGERDFDLLAIERNVCVGVIAEEASLGSPEGIANAARKKLGDTGTDVHFSEPGELFLDGRKWLRFTAQCQMSKIPFAYEFYVYAGPEGTFQVVSWTTQNLFERNVSMMRDVMGTFHLPKTDAATTPTPR